MSDAIVPDATEQFHGAVDNHRTIMMQVIAITGTATAPIVAATFFDSS